MNQIYIASNFGEVRVLYDDKKTNEDTGILRCVQKECKKKKNLDMNSFIPIAYRENTIVAPAEIYDR